MAESSKKPFPYKSKFIEDTRKVLASTEYSRFESVTKIVTKIEDGSTKEKQVILFVKQVNKFVPPYGYQDLEITTEIDIDLFNQLLEKSRGK